MAMEEADCQEKMGQIFLFCYVLLMNPVLVAFTVEFIPQKKIHVGHLFFVTFTKIVVMVVSENFLIH